MARSWLSTTPSKLKSPALRGHNPSPFSRDGVSRQPSVKPLPSAVESRNWPTSQCPPSQLACKHRGDRRYRISPRHSRRPFFPTGYRHRPGSVRKSARRVRARASAVDRRAAGIRHSAPSGETPNVEADLVRPDEERRRPRLTSDVRREHHTPRCSSMCRSPRRFHRNLEAADRLRQSPLRSSVPAETT